MKKLFVSIILALTLTACGNKTFIDTVYTFDTAIVRMPDGTTIVLKIAEWRDYEDGDQIQIKTTDGSVYLVHSVNCVLIQSGTEAYTVANT